MKDTTERANTTEKPTEEKKDYHAPEVQDYGTVHDLTLSSDRPAPGADGGTSTPNVYITSA